MNDKVILIISSEPWGDVYVSKHHYANYLSRNNKVYFLNPPSIPWNLNSLFNIPVSIREIQKGLNVIDYGNPIPLIFKNPKFMQDLAHKWIIKAIKTIIPEKEIDIIWSFDFKRFYNLQEWKARLVLFHAVELVDHQFFVKDAPFRHEVLQSSDLVVSIAKMITQQAKPWNDNILHLNHGVYLNEKKSSTEINLPGNNKQKAGFIGNFQITFDFDLLEQLANENQDVDFIMVGPKGKSNLTSVKNAAQDRIEALETKENVFFIGKIAPSEISNYLSAFDYNLILYKDGYHDGHCNPHKTMSYFLSGNPNICTFIDEYSDRADLIKMSIKNNEFPALFTEVKNNYAEYNSPEMRQKRIDFAKGNSYENQINKIARFIENKGSE